MPASPHNQSDSADEMGEPDLPIWERLTDDALGILTSDPLKAQEIALEALEARPGHPRAQHCMAEALARRGNHAAADAIFRQAVSGDGNLVELKDQGKDKDHQPWIGRFESICCPACESEAFEPAWVGNISAHHRCHGLLDPIRLWGRCLTCGLHRVVAPPPPETLERWSQIDPSKKSIGLPPTADELSHAMAAADPLLERIQSQGFGESWVNREPMDLSEEGPPRPNLLVVGAGWGGFLAAASWRNFVVHGTESVPERATWIKRHLGAEVVIGHRPSDAPRKPYDVIVLDLALQNCEDPISVFEEAASLLEPDGLLALSTPSLDHPVHRLLAYDDPGWSDPLRRIWFDRQALAVSLLRAQLQPVGTWHAPHAPGSVHVLARRIPQP